MKKVLAVVSLGLLAGACSNGSGAIPAAEIGSMSGDKISVVYYDSVSGMGDATQMAMAYCDPQTPVRTGASADAGDMPDKTVVTFQCKTVEKKK